MKLRNGIAVALCALVAVVAYVGRGTIRDAWDAIRAPSLPSATRFVPIPASTGSGSAAGPSPSTFEGGYATSEHFALESSPVTTPKPKDPLAWVGVLPERVNLDVPFLSQAPFSDWGEPYQNACEEMALIMVDGFYNGQGGRMSPQAGDDAIKKLVAYENATLGDYVDTNAEQTAELARSYFKYATVLVRPFATVDELKAPLAHGYPVIIPFAGKLLHNPNFRNGGPAYHMLVLRGYTPDLFITNDPGTRKGEQYTYQFATLKNAAHEWTGDEATITTGKRLMIVILPNP